MDVATPAWLARAVGLTGGSLWGGALTAAVFGPFWVVMRVAGWPSTPAAWESSWWSAVGASAVVTVVFCGVSAWAVLDWARYNAEMRARKEAYEAATRQLQARKPAFVAAVHAMQREAFPGSSVEGHVWPPAEALCAPLYPPGESP